MSRAREKWESIAVCVFILSCAAAWMTHTVIKADQYSDCAQRGGQIGKAGGEPVCKMNGSWK